MRLASRIRTFLFSMRRRLIASHPERLAEQGIARQLRWPLMLRLTLRRFSCLWKAMRARISRWKMNLRSRLCRIHSRRKRFRLRRRLRWRCMALRLGLLLLMLLRLLRGFILCCGTAFSDCAPCGKFAKGSRKTDPYTPKGRAPGKAGVAWRSRTRMTSPSGLAPPRFAFGAVGFQVIVVQQDAQARH